MSIRKKSNVNTTNGTNGFKEDEELEFEPRPPIKLKKTPLDQDYNVHEELGKGKFGVVKRVTDKKTGTVYAAKYIKTSGALSGSSRDDVMREIDIMSRMHHKRLVGLLDAYDANRNIIMIMEFISGGELFERVVDEDCLTEKEAAYYMHQLLQGIEHVHKKNVLHLDLKPENIVCVSKDSWDIKLIDFGLAQEYKEGFKMTALKGTPEFMAPEAANFEPISKATDMWSVGVIAYILLSGLSPFMGDDNNETLSNVNMCEWDFDDESFDVISDQAKDFISSLLIKNAKKRNTVEQCLKHEWMKKQQSSESTVKINTNKLKQFLAKRRWQKSMNAIKAVRRLSSMSSLLGMARKSIAPSLDTVNATEADENETNPTGDCAEISDGATKNGAKTEKKKEAEKTAEPAFLNELEDVTVNEGDPITFEVEVTGDPGCKIEWFKNGSDVEESDVLKLVNHGNGRHSLKITACDDDSMGEYCCVASNESGRVTTASYLTVEVPGEQQDLEDIAEEEEEEEEEESEPEGDPPVFVHEFTDIEVKEGESVTLDVEVKAEHYELEWYKNAVDVVEGGRVRFTSGEGGKHALVIEEVEDNDQGEYCCVAMNDAGRTTCAGNLTVAEEEEESESEDETDEEFYEEKVVKLRKEHIEDFYALEEEVGRGRFGVVRKCVHLKTAVHFVAKSIKARPSQKEEFSREIDVMNELRHPNLSRIRDAFDKPREIIIVMEYNRGGDLLERVAESPMSEPDAVGVVDQILDAVSFMHEHDYMHLDLKPENVMFKREGGSRVKIIDFSLTRKYNTKVDTKISYGTAEYVAPEVVAYDRVTPYTDMWSVGVTTYMILSGSSPFLGTDEADTFNNISQCKWAFTKVFDDVTTEAKEFISKLLVKSPSGRMSAKKCLVHPWITTVGRQGKTKRTSTVSHPPTESLSDISSSLAKGGDLTRSISSMESFLRSNSSDAPEDGKQSVDAKELEATLQSFLTKLKEVEAERAELEDQLKTEEEKIDKLEGEIEQRATKEKDLKERMRKLEKNNEKLANEVKSKNDLLVKVALLETERKRLEEELKTKEKSYSKIEDKCKSMKDKLGHYDDLEDKVYRYERERKSLTKENKELKEELEDLKISKNELEEKKLGLEKKKTSEIEDLEKERNEAEKKYNSLRKEKENLVSELTKKFEMLERQKSSLVEENKVLQDSVKDLKIRLKKSNQDLNKITEELKSTLEEIEMVKKKGNKDLEEKVGVLSKEKSNLEKEANKYRKQREETQKTCEELASKLSKAYAEMEKMKSENTEAASLEKLQKENADLHSQVEKLEAKNLKLSKDLKLRTDEIDELQDKLDTLALENQRLFDMQTTTSETSSERESETDSIDGRSNEQLEAKVMQLQSTLVAHESTIESLSGEVTVLEDKLHNETSKNSELEGKVEKQRQDIKRIKREKSEMVDKYEDELEEALDCYEESKKEMEQRFEKRIRDLEVASAESPKKSERVMRTIPQLDEVLRELTRLNESRRTESDKEIVNILKRRIILFDEITNKDMAFVLQEKNEIVRNLTSNLDTLNAEIEQLKSASQLMKRENKELELKVQELEKFAKEKAAKSFDLECKFAMLDKEKKVGGGNNVALQRRCEELEHEINALRLEEAEMERLKAVEIDYKKLQKQQEDIQRELEDKELLAEENKCFGQETLKLRKEKLEEYKLFSKIEKNNVRLKEDLKMVCHELNKLKQEHSKCMDLYNDQNCDIMNKNEEIEQLSVQVSKLTDQLEKGIDKYLKLEREASNLREEIAELEQENLELNTSFSNLSFEFVGLQNTLENNSGRMRNNGEFQETNLQKRNFQEVVSQKKDSGCDCVEKHRKNDCEGTISFLKKDIVQLRQKLELKSSNVLGGVEGARRRSSSFSGRSNHSGKSTSSRSDKKEQEKKVDPGLVSSTLERRYKDLEIENKTLKERNEMKSTALEKAIGEVSCLRHEINAKEAENRTINETNAREKERLRNQIKTLETEIYKLQEGLKSNSGNNNYSAIPSVEAAATCSQTSIELHSTAEYDPLEDLSRSNVNTQSSNENTQLKAVHHRILTCVQRPLEEAKLPWGYDVSADDVILGRFSAWEKIKENIRSLVEDREKLMNENKSLQDTWCKMRLEYQTAKVEYEALRNEREALAKELKQGLHSTEEEDITTDTRQRARNSTNSTDEKLVREAHKLKVELEGIRARLAEDTKQIEALQAQKQDVMAKLDELRRLQGGKTKGSEMEEELNNKMSQMKNLLEFASRFDEIVSGMEGKWKELEQMSGMHRTKEQSAEAKIFLDETREFYTTRLVEQRGGEGGDIDCRGNFYRMLAKLEREEETSRDLVQKNRQIQELTQEVESLTAKLQQSELHAKPDPSSTRNSSDEADLLKKEIQTLQKEKDELNAFVKDSVRKQEMYSAELETLRQEKGDMEKEIEGLNRFIKDSSIPLLRREITRLEDAEKSSKKEKDELNLEISKRDRKITMLEEDMTKREKARTGTRGMRDVEEELREELKQTKDRVVTLEAELEQLKAKSEERVKSQVDEIENKWAKRLRKECSELQAELAEKFNHDKRVWQRKEMELQNMIIQMKALLDKRAKDAQEEKKRLEQELANVSSGSHDNTPSLDSNSFSDGEPPSPSTSPRPSQNGGTPETPDADIVANGDALNDRELRRVSYKLTTDEWSQLGTFLGVPETDLAKLTAINMGPQEKAFRLMCQWRSQSRLGKNQLVSELAVALEEIGRKDVAQFVVEQLMSGKPRKKFFGWLK
ncbi:rootletin-like isoform X2 [Nematostella vectensis]|uniref:rootletin-like isoform X2 n=1 Tax=Nematostella vectensis TaxID=45351 RepID=UPI0020770196|nr:rootletin-like isoform X2 [Nematostella vectensis]